MRLSDIYSIKPRYSRSTRIDTDFNADAFEGLLFHATAENTLTTLSHEFQANRKAFTITGPYGSGKSTVALLLSGLLSNDATILKLTESIIGSDLFQNYRKSFNTSKKGYLVIRALGGLSNPIEMLTNSVIAALKEQSLKNEIKWVKTLDIESEDQFIDFYETLHDKLKDKVDGILLIHDELGKTLEHINRENGDLHLFQDLSERISRYAIPSIYIGLLHQGFSEYAKDKTSKTRAEWAKIQGRFVDLLYQVSTDEIMSLISESIATVSTKPSKAASSIVQSSDEIIASYAREDLKSSNTFRKNIAKLGALHPYVASLLGVISRRQFSQNERSIFSFLGSMEPNSLRNFLEEHDLDYTSPYLLSNLWDFLEYNLEFHILPSEDGKQWSEAKDAINRAHLKCTSKHAVPLLKTIALINLFGNAAHLFATKTTLLLAHLGLDHEDFEKALEELNEHSLVSFRSHINSYVIFAGSDIDVPSLIAEYLPNIQETEWLNIIEEELQKNLIIAKRHYHETGTLHWLDVRLAKNALELEALTNCWTSRNNSSAAFILLLDRSLYEQAVAKNTTLSHFYAFGLIQNYHILAESAKELVALATIMKKEEANLAHDPIAKSLINDRKTIAQKNLQDQLNSCLINAEWFGKNSHNLTEIASIVIDELYSKSLHINNEIINRQKPSGTAITARRKLIDMMIDPDCFCEENLGFDDKFPPEKAIYLTCIKALGIHQKINDEYGFSEPTDEATQVLFNDTLELLKKSEGISSINDIYMAWSQAPYGVTDGVFPLLVTAFIMVYQDKLALYDFDSTQKFVFVPEADDIITTKIIKKPEHVGLRYTESATIQPYLLKRLAEIETGTSDHQANVLSVARSLVTFVHALPHWTKNTLNLTKNAISFRNEALRASDPHKFIFEDLPKIFKCDETTSPDLLKDEIENVVNELKEAYPSLLLTFKEAIKERLGEFDENFKERCKKVAETSSDFRLKGFAERCLSANDENTQWTESVISLLSKSSNSQWTDSKIELARESLLSFSRRFFQILKMYDLDRGDDLMTVSLVSEQSGKQSESMINIRLDKTEIDPATKNNVEAALSNLQQDERIWLLSNLLQEQIEQTN
ncbi:hypothetical protein QCB45_09715 [Thiomicrorhabdus sp. ZW0627]|uniref:hypothetical protein n=1 Tax=Thiomicrorhabdus sp. ZW0627 TaxID=3039774 RepID=UPI0024366104|nr:hypothetical protein [Thiomicrorhabdus sp. ZW0627]MDG6774610.1 hypothetical protein [Thiomicrorhabdus sp. ZW0627]